MKYLTMTIFVLSAMIATSCTANKSQSHLTTRQVIDSLGLLPMNDEACPGYFFPTFESKIKADIPKDRPAASLIYYLMPPEVPIDPWHIISSDEIMLYHAGAPLIMMLLYPDGSWEEVVLGPKIDKGHVMQHLIPAGTWMGFVKAADPNYDWGLYGVLVVPGWHIDDIRMILEGPELDVLMKQYPETVLRGKELGLF